MKQTFNCNTCKVQLTKTFKFDVYPELNCPRCGEYMDKINMKSLAAHARGQ